MTIPKLSTNSIWWGVLTLCVVFVSWVIAGTIEQAKTDSRQDTQISTIKEDVGGINSKLEKIDDKLDILLEKTTRNERSE